MDSAASSPVLNKKTKKANAKKNRSNQKSGTNNSSDCKKVMSISSESRFFHIICFDNGVMPLENLSENKEKRESLILTMKRIMLDNTSLTTVEVLARAGVYNSGVMCGDCLSGIADDNKRCKACYERVDDDTLWSLILSSRREWLSNMERGKAFVKCVNELIASTEDCSGTFVKSGEVDESAVDGENTKEVAEDGEVETTTTQPQQQTGEVEGDTKKKGGWTLWPFF